MSHYLAIVVIPATEANEESFDVTESVREKLAPYDENLQFPYRIVKTRAQRLHEARIKNFTYATEASSPYQEYLKDPEEYAKKASAGHMEYIKDFPKLATMGDEELFEHITKYDT